MQTLHVMPGHSAAGSLTKALKTAGLEDRVLAFPDDLSCGPIQGEDDSARAEWWAWMFCGDPKDRAAYTLDFWHNVATTDNRIVAWWGRHSSCEFAFFMALADRLNNRLFSAIDVTGIDYSFTRSNGLRVSTGPAQAVSRIRSEILEGLLGTEKLVTSNERQELAVQWHRLRQEDAPFRVLSSAGLVSAPIEHFDALLLKHMTTDWQKLFAVISGTSKLNDEVFIQTNVHMLHMRVVTLVELGRVLADGDPYDANNCRVRLSGST